MKTKVLLEAQVVDFIRRQSPDIRKSLRDKFHRVENGDLFPEPLEDELEGFYKLKCERCRILLKAESGESGPVFKAVFAERRAVIYELFKQMLGLE